MRFRPANISLINRRLYLPRLLLTLPSIETDDQRILTGHYISCPDRRPLTRNSEFQQRCLFWCCVDEYIVSNELSPIIA